MILPVRKLVERQRRRQDFHDHYFLSVAVTVERKGEVENLTIDATLHCIKEPVMKIQFDSKNSFLANLQLY